MKISIFIFLSIFFISCFSSKQTVKNYTYSDFKLLSSNITKEILKDISGNVVVLPLYTKETGKQRISKLGKIISEEIQYNVAQKKDIKVMERVDLDKLINEYELLTSSGFTNDEQDKKMGWEGANFIILGTIEEIMGNYDVRIKIIDKKTGTVKPSPLFTLKKDKEGNFEKIFTEPANYTTYTEQLVDKSDVKEKDNSLKSEELKKEEDSQKTFDKNKSNAKTELNNAMNEYDGNNNSKKLTKDDIIKMSNDGIKDTVIIENIKLSKSLIKMEKEDIIDMKKANVSEQIIKFLIVIYLEQTNIKVIEKKEIPKFECTLYNCNPNLEKFEELPKITEKYFSGTYIIKPLYAIYTFKDDGESGVGDLFVTIKVGDENFSTRNNFKQDVNEVEFDGEYFEVDINKDNLISLSLWDADAFDDDVLVSKEGLIPMDLDENGIITLKNEKGTVSFLVIKKPYFEGEYKIYNKEILYKQQTIDISESKIECSVVSMNYLYLFSKNKDTQKYFNKKIDNFYDFTKLIINAEQDETYHQNYSIVMNENNILSLKLQGSFGYCSGNMSFGIGASLNYDLSNNTEITIEKLLTKNAVNSNTICNKINSILKTENLNDNIIECKDETNNKYNDFNLINGKIVFLIRQTDSLRGHYYYPSFTFEELQGIIDTDNDILKKISK